MVLKVAAAAAAAAAAVGVMVLCVAIHDSSMFSSDRAAQVHGRVACKMRCRSIALLACMLAALAGLSEHHALDVSSASNQPCDVQHLGGPDQ